MSRLKLFFVLTVIAPACISAAQGQAWKVYQPEGGIFSVKLPGTPTTKTQSFNDPKSGQVDLTLYILHPANMLYLMEDAKIANTPSEAECHKILVDFQGGFLNSSGMTLVSSQEMMYKGYLARKITAKKNNMLSRGIAVMAGNHNISFFVTVQADQINSSAVTRFLNSIKINGK